MNEGENPIQSHPKGFPWSGLCNAHAVQPWQGHRPHQGLNGGRFTDTLLGQKIFNFICTKYKAITLLIFMQQRKKLTYFLKLISNNFIQNKTTYIYVCVFAQNTWKVDMLHIKHRSRNITKHFYFVFLVKCFNFFLNEKKIKIWHTDTPLSKWTDVWETPDNFITY